MNLFVESVNSYLTSQCDRLLDGDEGTEVRIFIQSLPPDPVQQIFSFLEERYFSAELERHLKIAKGLWEEWCERYPAFRNRLEQIERNGWVDLEDRLTHYRNLNCPPSKRGLLVVIVGLDHAPDKGGLSDFHVVRESTIWNKQLKRSFAGWLDHLISTAGHPAGDALTAALEKFLVTLFQHRPRSLVDLSDFLEREIYPSAASTDTGSALVALFYEKLPFWGIPPLLDIGNPERQGHGLLAEAATFISHQPFQNRAERKKAKERVDNAIVTGTLAEIPRRIVGAGYPDLEEFVDTVKAFIDENDFAAKERLLDTDLTGLLTVLRKKRKEPRGDDPPEKVLKYRDPVLIGMLKGIWETLKEFKKVCGHTWAPSVINGVEVRVVGFRHNLKAKADDSDEGAEQQLAQRMLTGIVGGLDSILGGMEISLRGDRDEPERNLNVPIEYLLDEDFSCKPVRAQPHLEVRVTVQTAYDGYDCRRTLHLILDDNAEERVRYQYARRVLGELGTHMCPIVPVFTMDRTFTETFFACDGVEANRLIREGLEDLRVGDILQGVASKDIAPQLWHAVASLATAYRSYLVALVDQGPFAADEQELFKVVRAYRDLTDQILQEGIGDEEILARFYKAFFVVPKRLPLTERYLDSAVAIGISPVVSELVHARNRFLLNGFPEAVAEMLEYGIERGGVALERLLGLVEIRRPVAALIRNRDRVLTTRVKSFSMIHCIGVTPESELSLASQSIMREGDVEDESFVKELIKPSEESKLIRLGLSDYQELHPYANDQMRVLVVNVEDLQPVVAGVHRFLEEYLKDQPIDLPELQFYLKVYSKSTSPGAITNQLTAWRDLFMQKERSTRGVKIRIGHRYAPTREKICWYLSQEESQFDVAFLMRFMDSDGGDNVEPVEPFEYDYALANVSKFPIVEHPRTARLSDLTCRQTLLSSRRLSLQTCHTELSARLAHPYQGKRHHLIFGMVDYAGWKDVVNRMHEKAQWVVCIDPYVDKRLLEGMPNEHEGGRKIVGFASGLGCYGELNMTVSTEADPPSRLIVLAREQFRRLFPNWPLPVCERAAQSVLSETQELTGLSLIQAVGASEHIRDVVAYAAVRKLLKLDRDSVIEQLIPLDSVRHWFQGAEQNLRPDLLHLSVRLDGTLLCLHATVIECKLGQSNDAHVTKAVDQIRAGLRRLSHLFMPNGHEGGIGTFDRRYWWAQLQRAIASRALVNMTKKDYDILNVAFEHLTEGYYTIEWDAMIVTIWSDRPVAGATTRILPINLGGLLYLPEVPDSIDVRHVELGADAVASIFTGEEHPTLPIDRTLFGCTFVDRDQGTRSEESGTSVDEVESSQESYSEANNSDATVDGACSDEGGITPTGGTVGDAPEPEIADLSGDYQGDPTPAAVVPEGKIPEVSVAQKNSAQVPERILIGTGPNGQPFFWEYGHENLQNRHLLIFGTSGSGKTYAIQCLLAEMAMHRQSSLIVDYTDGFLPEHLEEAFVNNTALETHLVVEQPLPINPFQIQTQTIAGKIIKDSPFKIATRIASVFTSVYNSIGEQQNAELISTIEAGLESGAGYDLDALLNDLNDRGDTARVLANKIAPFIKTRPFGRGTSDDWKAAFAGGGTVSVLQLATVSRDIQRLITEFVLWDLYNFASTNGNKNVPLPIVLDEIQNLDHRQDSPLEKLLREGRKFGISLILATQTLSNFEAQERDRLFQAAHKLFFAPADTEIKRFADILKDNFPSASKDEWTQRLSRLRKGECLSIGPALSPDGRLVNRVVQLKVTSMQERFHAQR